MVNLIKNLFSGVECNELENEIHDEAFFVDVRTPTEFSENHVLGSVNIPLSEVK